MRSTINKYIRKHEIILSFIFSIITLFGDSYKKINSWNLVFNNPLQSILSFLSYFIIFLLIIALTEKICLTNKKNTPSKISNYIFDKHPFLLPLCIIILCWLPYIIIKYPGSPGWDFYHFLNDYYNFDGGLTQHFPLVYVFLCVYFIKFGILIKNVNLSLFLLTLLHAIIMAFSFSTIFNYLKKWNTSYKVRWFILLFYSTMSLFGNYATTIYHDILYSSFILLYVLTLTDVISEKNIQLKKYLTVSVLSLLICLTRKNGIYIVLPTNLYLIIKYLLKKEELRKTLKISLCAIPIILFFISEILFSLKYIKTSYLEAMAIPIQTISRYSVYYHNDITESEKEDINGIINYKFAAALYNPTIVDGVRNYTGNYNASTNQITNFFKTWIKLFFRHPNVYIEAIINTNYPLYYPFFNATFTFFEVKEESNYKTYVNFSSPQKLTDIKNNLRNFHYKIESIPLLMYINDPGIYVWILFYIIMLIYKNKTKIWLPLLPMIMTFICCFNAPTIDYNTRYLFPIIFSILPLFCFYSSKLKRANEALTD